MKRIKNQYLVIGILFLVLAIILNKIGQLNDLIIGILYGISFSLFMMSIYKRTRHEES